MTEHVANRSGDSGAPRAAGAGDELVLASSLAGMAPLSEWVDKVASQHGLSRQVAFAARLCLEESISNAIRHGYREQPGCEVRVRFSGSGAEGAVFTVEDDAPCFDPLQQALRPAIHPHAFELGGHGIRLMRAFAGSLRYEANPAGNRAGNRLRIEFAGTPQQASASPDGVAPR
jgi:anti-sigma regulatory factor (Ser/Thr protein kinase)